MCGFFVVLSKKNKISSFKNKIINSTKLIKHRGPDSEEYYFNENIGIGFTRLSIQDLSSLGNQPMKSENERFVIVFNGEIYNASDLRSELNNVGYKFSSFSDTEVLLTSFIEWRESLIQKIRGMFSFIIWDKKEESLFVCRDRLGIKPLYHYEDRSFKIFSSEIKSINSFLDHKENMNLESVYRYLARGWSQDTLDTFYQNIYSFPAGCYSKIYNESKKNYRYWNLNFGNKKRFNESEFFSKFKNSVETHLISDVPVGLTLSGGMDSSSITAIAASQGNFKYPLKAFSTIPPFTTNEKLWIDDIVNKFDLDHEYLDINFNDISQIINEILRFHDEPFLSSNCIYQYLLRKKISEKGIKVLLVGEGGDEVLGGYRRFIYPYINDVFGEDKSKSFYSFVNKASKFLELDSNTIVNNLNDFKNQYFSSSTQQENLSAYEILHHEFQEQFQFIREMETYPKKEKNIFSSYLQSHLLSRDLPNILKMEDSNSMAHSIEARVPFLDHEFVEYCANHNINEFMKDGENKSMLRRAMAEILPESIISRKSKSGRPGNDNYLIYNILHEEMKEILSNPDFKNLNLFCKNSFSLYEKDKLNNNSKRGTVWFRVFCFFKWWEQNFK
ncbi:asparagine synthase (glutamine-hydrolyzing) [Alphaproteobacteria bacterium]|nr:asparagine synthase (glutamine-hydrolyzing) [Alphaproteobacteria bacterium]